MTSFDEITAAAPGKGLRVRGGFHAAPGDGVPNLTDGRRARTVVLLGNIGSSLWPVFSVAPERSDGRPDPLDRWTVRMVSGLAADLGATPLYPFGGPPHWPFQRWAQRAEDVHPSPLGLLIHPEHGLWHAYRAALLFAVEIALSRRAPVPPPCLSCAAKPCLTACPVGAFSGTAYDVAGCTLHLAHEAGADCMKSGCRARRACPIGSVQYEPAHTRFHMDAFLRAHPPSESS